MAHYVGGPVSVAGACHECCSETISPGFGCAHIWDFPLVSRYFAFDLGAVPEYPGFPVTGVHVLEYNPGGALPCKWYFAVSEGPPNNTLIYQWALGRCQVGITWTECPTCTGGGSEYHGDVLYLQLFHNSGGGGYACYTIDFDDFDPLGPNEFTLIGNTSDGTLPATLTLSPV